MARSDEDAKKLPNKMLSNVDKCIFPHILLIERVPRRGRDADASEIRLAMAVAPSAALEMVLGEVVRRWFQGDLWQERGCSVRE